MAFDGFTLLHIFFGAFAAATGRSRRTAYAIALGVEVGELVISENTEIRRFDETRGNVVVDLVAFALAYEGVRAIKNV